MATIWRYFTLSIDRVAQCNSADCNFARNYPPRASTTNLKCHLKGVHPELFEQLQLEEKTTNEAIKGAEKESLDATATIGKWQNLRDIYARNKEQQQPAAVETTRSCQTRRQFEHCAGTSPSPAPPAKKERSKLVEGDEDDEHEHLSEFIRKNRLIEEAELIEKQLFNYKRCTELGLPARIHLPLGTGPRRSQQRQCRRFTTFSNPHACQFDAERQRADAPPRDGDLNEGVGTPCDLTAFLDN